MIKNDQKWSKMVGIYGKLLYNSQKMVKKWFKSCYEFKNEPSYCPRGLWMHPYANLLCKTDKILCFHASQLKMKRVQLALPFSTTRADMKMDKNQFLFRLFLLLVRFFCPNFEEPVLNFSICHQTDFLNICWKYSKFIKNIKPQISSHVPNFFDPSLTRV